MAKTKSISALVTELQAESNRAQFLSKLFNQAVKHEFGYGVEELHELISKAKLMENRVSPKQDQHISV